MTTEATTQLPNSVKCVKDLYLKMHMFKLKFYENEKSVKKNNFLQKHNFDFKKAKPYMKTITIQSKNYIVKECMEEEDD